jgi:hypothetical protein
MQEVALRQLANQAKTARPGLIKRFFAASESFLKELVMQQKQESLSPDGHMVININSR